MVAYLNAEEFKDLSTMADADVDALVALYPQYLAAHLAHWSAWIDSQLRKRYAAPFAVPYPEAVKLWLARLVTPRMFLKRGVDPNDAQYVDIVKDADEAKAEIKEAADSETGLYDLPLRADTTATGISKGGPYGYSEASPYVWTDVQSEAGRTEDQNRRGTDG